MITLTPAALAHITNSLAARGVGFGIRLGVRTTGCSGMAYVLEFCDAQEKGDHRFDFGDISVFVDEKAFVVLDGTELDYVKLGLNAGFQFNNPNASGSCGCGESFSV